MAIMKFWPNKDTSYYKLKALFALGCYGFVAGVLSIAAVLYYFSLNVPDYRTLAEYSPKLITKVYDRNGEVIAEYAKQRRIYVPIDEIPQPVKDAYLAAEDDQFYQHSGFDLKGIFRAALVNIFTNRKQGASTITQQVAKTFLLTRERTYTRKIKELILSRRIEAAFSKDKILELYLNQIYLGNGAYGVAAASLAYYGKDMSELSHAQLAMLAGLPKAPSAYDPTRNPRVATFRRNVIIGRMLREGFITQEEHDIAIAEGLELNPTRLEYGDTAPHFSEHVRRFVKDMYGEDELYTAGFAVHTTLDKKLQEYAEDAVYKGVRDYDRRHGYRGPIDRLSTLMGDRWQPRIDKETKDWNKDYIGQPAIVLEIDEAAKLAKIGLEANQTGIIELPSLTWARKYISADERGAKVKRVSDVLTVNDIIVVRPMSQVYDAAKGAKVEEGFYSLEQVPTVQGSFVATDPETGAILAMVGGLDVGTGFNRVVQSKRQVGSSLKPIVYAMALEKGYTPASIVLDAPVVMRNTDLDGDWKPQNYSQKVFGESTIRRGLEKSRNLMTIRLARELGMGNIIRYIRKYGITANMERNLSTALGSSSISLLEMTNAYAVFANGGRVVKPYAVNYIQDAVGNVIYREQDECVADCALDVTQSVYKPDDLPVLGEQIIPETTAFQMAELLQGIVQNGTAWRAKTIGQPVGAKTGTTDDFIDAWLVGIAPNMAIGSWVGFDKPQTLGKSESGSKAAAPIWVSFGEKALNDGRTNLSYKVPEGITFVQIDADTGTLPSKDTKKRIYEAFVEGTEPTKTKKKAVKTSTFESDIQLQGIY